MDRKTDDKPVNVSALAGNELEAEMPLWKGLALGVAVAVCVSGTLVTFGRPHARPHVNAPAALQEAYDADGADEATQVARWAARSGDARQRPFIIVDKANARVMAFDASGR